MSSDEDTLDLVNLLNVNQNRPKRRYWIHPYWNSKQTHSAYNVFKQLNMYPERFQSFYRMSKETFDVLIRKIRPVILKDTNYRQAISPEERLLITLRYFATGCSFKALSYYFLRGHTTIRKIVSETSKAIWETLQPEFMPSPLREVWLKTADRYWELWNLPNCVGSIDGKHIRIKAPYKSGSAYFNYKGYFSIVLLAVSDADGLFLSIDIGEYGRNSDGRALRESAFGKALANDQLSLPEPAPLPGESESSSFPYYFAADEAFPLTNHIMKPYPRRQLTNKKRIFNYRLSRGRRSVECAFGILASKFRVLETPICCHVDKIDSIIQAVCVLHNFIRIRDGIYTNPTLHLNKYPANTNRHASTPQGRHQRPTIAAIEWRNRLCNFFVHPDGALPWQEDHCV